MEIVSVVIAISTVLLMSWAWKAFCWVWLEPKKMEKLFREQGIPGSSYRFLYGDVKQLVSSNVEARSKPMEFTHLIAPRVMPFFHQSLHKYGKISFTWLGPIPRMIITDPEMIRDVFTDKIGHFGKISSTPLRKLLITGLVSYEGEKWVKHRRVINPAFNLEKLKMMLPAFSTSCSDMVNKWKKLIPEESCELDVWPDIHTLAADVISRTAFGSSYEEGKRIFQLQTEQAKLIVQASQSIYIPGFRFLPTKRNNRIKEIRREVHTLLRDMINKREEVTKTRNVQSDDLLGLLMESNSKEIKDNIGNSKNVGISIEEVIEECKLFFFAGQETTANLLVWTMILLSRYREWQEKAREEVLQVFGTRKPDFEGLNHLKIVTMIMHEVLRLYPPVTLLLRGTCKKAKLGEVILPPGVRIVVPVLLVHQDRELWGEDALEFKPDRFAEGVLKATKNRVSYFPFGWGPRICIGQTFALIEAKMAIAMILQQFSFELSSTYVHAPLPSLTLQPQHGAQLIMRKI